MVQTAQDSSKPASPQGGSTVNSKQTAPQPLTVTVNSQPRIVNQRGFLPRLGPRQMVVLLAIVVILLLVVVFFVLYKSQITKNIINPGGSGQKLDAPIEAIKDVKFATSEANRKDYLDTINNAYKETGNNYRDVLVYIQYACQTKNLSASDKAKLKQSFDDIMKLVNKNTPEATQTPYIWYCP